jgi:proline iminopeptidase
LSTQSSIELTVQNDDAALHVEIAGGKDSDNVLVALHGGPGNSSDYMVSLKQLAGSDLSVVLYDQRGTGRSSVPISGYGLGQYVEDLEAVRKSINAERIHVFGHSWGGIVAMRYATIYPRNVKSLILMGSGPPNGGAFAAAQAHAAERIAALQRQGVIPEQIATIYDLLPAYFSDPGFEMPEELADMSYNPTAQNLTMAELGEYDITDDVSKLSLPVLVLWGEDDLFGVSMMDATVKALQNAEVKTVFLRECGHFWHERPEEFFLQIRAFLAGR